MAQESINNPESNKTHELFEALIDFALAIDSIHDPEIVLQEGQAIAFLNVAPAFEVGYIAFPPFRMASLS